MVQCTGIYCENDCILAVLFIPKIWSNSSYENWEVKSHSWSDEADSMNNLICIRIVSNLQEGDNIDLQYLFSWQNSLRYNQFQEEEKIT